MAGVVESGAFRRAFRSWLISLKHVGQCRQLSLQLFLQDDSLTGPFKHSHDALCEGRKAEGFYGLFRQLGMGSHLFGQIDQHGPVECLIIPCSEHGPETLYDPGLPSRLLLPFPESLSEAGDWPVIRHLPEPRIGPRGHHSGRTWHDASRRILCSE